MRPEEGFKEALKKRIKWILVFVGLLWAIEIVDFVLLGSLDSLGVHPGTREGLAGIFFAPFLHGGFGHLGANTSALIPLTFLVSLRGRREMIWSTLAIVMVSGLGTWAIAPSGTVHIGASGLIFGYLGFLLIAGFMARDKAWIVVSILTGAVYGGALWGVFPQQDGVSWQMHLFGFIGGVLAAYHFVRRSPNHSSRA